MSLAPVQRIVTGHDGAGKAIVSSSGALPTVVELAAIPGVVFHEVWNTAASPAPIDSGPDPTLGPLVLAPPPGGTRLRFVDIPPDTEELLARGAASVKEGFAEVGDVAASTVGADSPHPLMHRTESIDYGVVIEGELTLLLDHGEVVVRAGNVVVQRGTNHAWANRSGKPCRILFVLVSGQYEPALAAALKGGAG
jgi:hypothetical protein